MMLEILIGFLALMLGLPFVVLAVEAVSALAHRKTEIPKSAARVAVVIPAHNEASEIEATIRSIRCQLSIGDRIVVVSDNSTDATADIAASLGAHVVHRVDRLRVGKGYALEAGVRHLELDPPEVVVVIDADCHPEAGAISRVARRAKSENRAIQGISLVRPVGGGLLPKISSLAFHLRNDIRPRGLAALRLPALLQGTGMAIPWKQIVTANLGGSHLAEDRKLGISLAIDGRSPHSEPEARFWSSLEAESSVSGSQRSRWELGHLAAIREDLPRLISAAVRQRRPELLALGAELAVPPLALLLVTWIASIGISALVPTSPFMMGALLLPGVTAFGLLALASSRSSSNPISPGLLLAAPLYALAKLPIFVRAAAGRTQSWERSKRSSVGKPASKSLRQNSSDTYPITGVDINALTETECVYNVLDSCDGGVGGWVVTPNLDFLERSNRDPGFRAILRAATLSVPDGMPLVWAARIAGDPVRGRVAGSDLISSLCEEAAERGRSVFLLGGNEGSASAAADVLCEKYPALRIAGWQCPPFGYEHEEQELQKITNALDEAKPDLVFVGLGSPKSERLIASLHLTHRTSLSSTWWIGVGVSFSFLCGEIERAPVLLQRLGLEWTHRLIKEPRKLAGRYLARDLPFAFRLLAFAVARRTNKLIRGEST